MSRERTASGGVVHLRNQSPVCRPHKHRALPSECCRCPKKNSVSSHNRRILIDRLSSLEATEIKLLLRFVWQVLVPKRILQTAEKNHAAIRDPCTRRKGPSELRTRMTHEYSYLSISLWLVIEGSTWLVGFLGLQGRIACRRFLTSGVLNGET